VLNTEIAQNDAAQALVTAEQTHVGDASSTASGTASALAAAQTAASAGNAGLAAAIAASNNANAALTAAQTLSTNTTHDFDVLADNLGLEISVNGTITIENRSPDIGLSPSFNGWMTFFGQFFDHGLDLVSKGGSGTVFVPLMPDDPLYVVGGHSNFMVLTRAQNQPGADGILGTADDVRENINSTTPFIDQNQTYTSHPSHQVFLREYHMVGGKPMATGQLAHGAHGEANWGEIKAQAASMLGIQLVDMDVHNGPLLATDRYGEFLRGPNGFAQIVTVNGLVEGDPTANGGKGVLLPSNTIRTDHAFLNDIAHGAAPGFYDHDNNPTTPKIALVADSDNVINGQPNPNFDPTKPITDNNPLLIPQPAGTYDNEMLDRHFITGDGRGNENIGLTAVHSVFHSEHNRLVQDFKHTILASGNLATINEWLLTDLTSLAQVPTTEAAINALNWDGERLFQAGRFVTEMQYQHLVFEEFARTVQPGIDPFVFTNSADIDPAITAEFAHVVYRFGHSMLNENVIRTDINNVTTDIGLIQAFLNPIAFDNNGGLTEQQAIGSIVRGMTHQVGNAIDEFVTEALRNNLVGLPLDLAVLNMARARDTGMPSFNEARAQFYAMSGAANLTPYTSWADMAPHLKNAASIVNFIAAYGTHSSITSATTLQGKHDAAMLLVFGGANAPADRVDFLQATGAYTAQNSGLNDVDFWIGGLAEEINQFGGMLGATFNFVFETQLEKLQNGDRFYYLSRTQGTNMLNELEANSFAALVMRNTDLGAANSSHVPGHLFQTPNYILEVDMARQVGADPLGTDPILNALNPLVIRRAPGADVNGDGAADGGTVKYTGFDHTVIGGTAGNDVLYGGGGIDTIWGDAGNDRIDAGDEADEVHGGDGDDIITDHGTPVGGADFLRGDEGNDVIFSGNGNDIVFGGGGSDFIVTGDDFTEVFAGRGDDFILGGSGADGLMGNEGDDWIEGGEGFDGLSGENSELFFNSPIVGHDVLNGQGNDTDYDGESGDDIMFEGAGIQRNNGMFGFDWAIHKDDVVAANSDLGIGIFLTQPQFTLRDRFDSVEGLSGWKFNDVLTGSAAIKGATGGAGAGPGNPVDESDLKAKNVHLINGLKELLGLTQAQLDALVAQELIEEAVVPVSPTAARSTSLINVTQGAEIIMGGGGSDTIKGNLGNDVIDGDAWLNVRISVRANKDGTGPELFTVNSMNEIKARMVTGEINPGQLKIVREILQATTALTDTDTAVYNGNIANYTIVNNNNATFTITDNRVGVLNNDGVDTLRNIEKLQFADGVVTIAVPGNKAPVITSNGGGAAAALSLVENGTLVTTFAATDPNNVINDPLNPQSLTYAISGGADAAKFSINATTGVLSFVIAPDFEAPTDAGANNVYDVIVQVNDGYLIDTQTLAVTVTNGNDAPIISSNGGFGSANISIAENSTAAVTTVIATDPENNPVTYSISGGVDAAKFAINATTGVLSFVASPNFEAPTDVGANNIYNVIVAASDGSLVDTQALAVTVTNVNEAATGGLRITGYTTSATGANLTATNTVVDPDGMTNFVQYQWQRQGGGGNWSNIAGATNATLANQVNTTVRVVTTYNDPFGANTVISDSVALITGTGANNTRVGTAANEILLGLGGNDVLTGGAGNDTVDGGTGNDRLVATVNDGNDVYVGGTGVDTYDLSGTTADSNVNLTAGTASSAQTGTDTLSGIENIIGSTGNNAMTDGAGSNQLDGRAGNDTFVMTDDNARDNIIGGAGTDTINYSGLTTNLNVTLNLNNQVVVGGSGTNTDVIAGIENFIGGSGNDTITGDSLSNALNGGAGSDTITGGTGADVLAGGLGADVFSYGNINQSGIGVAARDSITDFLSGTDKLNFAAIDADTRGAAPGNQAFTFNNTAGAAFTAAGQLVYHYEGTGSNEITVIQGNVNANLGADFEIALTGHVVFNVATDIVL
jgi:Ca2+-binding RTX toxin-like protein